MQQFIVSPQQKAIVLNPAHPEMLCNLLPMAKGFEWQGHKLWAVPHDIDVVRLLRNVGVPAPSPILSQYKWSGQREPFMAQRATAEFLTLNPRAFCLNDMGCVDGTTEYLSPTGWKRIDQYDGGLVAQYHPDTGRAEFVQPTEYVKRPCEDMIRIKTKYGVDQLLSPEHRVLLQDRSNPDKHETVQAAELYARHVSWLEGAPTKKSSRTIGWSGSCIPVTFKPKGGSGLPLSDAQLRLQVAVIADGHFPGDSNRCVVRLKRLRKIERLRRLLFEAGVDYRHREIGAGEARSDVGFHIFSFRAPTHDKEFGPSWWECTLDQLRLVADEVMHWDGSISADPGKGPRFSTTVRASADFVQYAYVATGSSARVMEADREGRTEFTVQVRPGVTRVQLQSLDSAGTRRKVMEWWPSPDGFKYCFMVPSTYLVFRRNGCVFASGNTGKTLSVLWAYDYLRSIGKRRRMLVAAPLSTLERTWGDEIFRNFPHLTFAILHGTRERRLKLLAHPFDIYIVNHDGIEILADQLAHRPDIDLVVVDELAVLRNSQTERYKAAERICSPVERWVWGLTGTPIPNAPTDAWAQVKLVNPGRVPKYFGRFRDQVMTKFGPYKWVARPNAIQQVQDVMQPAIRFSRDDCVDLPETTYQTRHIDLTSEQKKVYDEVRNRMKSEAEEGTVRAVNEADKLMKLVQVAAGAVYTTEGETVTLENGPRIREVKEIIEQSPGKVIVFVPFIAALQHTREELAKDYPTELVYGGTSKSERDSAFWRFQNLPKSESRVLVANAAAMSHGLTLTEASTVVWVAPTTSHETFDQANHRIIRPGQKNRTLIVMLEGTPVERQIYARLQQRQAMQGLLLEAVREAGSD